MLKPKTLLIMLVVGIVAVALVNKVAFLKFARA
jgi:hypothetical protein